MEDELAPAARPGSDGARAPTPAELDRLHGAIAARFAPERPLVLAGHPLQDATRALLAGSCEVRALAGDLSSGAAGLEHAVAVMAFMTERIDRGFLSRAPRLQIVAGALKGADNIDLDELSARGVWVSVCEELLSEPTADLALALLLGLARRTHEGDRLVRAGEFRGWRPRLYGVDLRGRTLGIIGMGAVGLAVARRAVAFGMQVVYCDPRPLAQATAAELGAERVELEPLLARAEICMPLLPLTETTLGLIDAAAIARMPAGALLINVARGSLVDEDAVAAALRDGHLGGYAADVFAFEDLSIAERPDSVPGSLMADTERTLLTPHLGSAIASVRGEIELEAASNILIALGGGRPPGAINTPSRPRDPVAPGAASRDEPPSRQSDPARRGAAGSSWAGSSRAGSSRAGSSRAGSGR